MLAFLFWNLRNKSLKNLVAHLADAHAIDVLLLAECDIEDAELAEVLNLRGRAFIKFNPPTPGRVQIWMSSAVRTVGPVHNSATISICEIVVPSGLSLLLAAVHFQSKLHLKSEEQPFLCGRLVREVEESEKLKGHSRTIIVGDLNMNPFEYGMVAADGLHSVASRRDAARESRIALGESKRLFYNPMWNRFGEKEWCPPGTYYYHASGMVEYFWHIFDQVLIRPSLLDRFSDDDLQIVTKVGDLSLLDADGRPNQKLASDHLPILFKLSI